MTEESKYKRKSIKIGGIPMPVYMVEDGEYRWSMRQASIAVGYGGWWLRDARREEGNVLAKLRSYGFTGEIIPYQEKGAITSYLISTEDFMAMVMYAAYVGEKKQAIALMFAAFQETLERRADYAFGVIRDEDEYIQKFESRYASIILNKNLRAAIRQWIEENTPKGLVDDYIKEYSIKGGPRGIYASALGEIYKVLFGKYKKDINEYLEVPKYRTPKDTVRVEQLQHITQIEELAKKYIELKKMAPIEAIQAAAEALMIEVEEPKLGDRITRQDVHRVLSAKKQQKIQKGKKNK